MDDLRELLIKRFLELDSCLTREELDRRDDIDLLDDFERFVRTDGIYLGRG